MSVCHDHGADGFGAVAMKIGRITLAFHGCKVMGRHVAMEAQSSASKANFAAPRSCKGN